MLEAEQDFRSQVPEFGDPDLGKVESVVYRDEVAEVQYSRPKGDRDSNKRPNNDKNKYMVWYCIKCNYSMDTTEEAKKAHREVCWYKGEGVSALRCEKCFAYHDNPVCKGARFKGRAIPPAIWDIKPQAAKKLDPYKVPEVTHHVAASPSTNRGQAGTDPKGEQLPDATKRNRDNGKDRKKREAAVINSMPVTVDNEAEEYINDQEDKVSEYSIAGPGVWAMSSVNDEPESLLPGESLISEEMKSGLLKSRDVKRDSAPKAVKIDLDPKVKMLPKLEDSLWNRGAQALGRMDFALWTIAMVLFTLMLWTNTYPSMESVQNGIMMIGVIATATHASMTVKSTIQKYLIRFAAFVFILLQWTALGAEASVDTADGFVKSSGGDDRVDVDNADFQTFEFLKFWQFALLLLNIAVIGTAFITFVAVKDLSGLRVPAYKDPDGEEAAQLNDSVGPEDSVSRIGESKLSSQINPISQDAYSEDMFWYQPSFWSSKTTIVGSNGETELRWWVHVMFVRIQLAVGVSIVSNLLLSTSSDLKWKFLSALLLVAIVLNVGNFSALCQRKEADRRMRKQNTLIEEFFPTTDPRLAMINGSIPGGVPEREASDSFLKDHLTAFLTMKRRINSLPRSKHNIEVAVARRENFKNSAEIDFSSNRPYIDALLGGVINKAILLDSGASLSMIPKFMVEEIEEKIGEKLPEYPDEEPLEDLNLTTVTGAPIKVVGKVLVPVTIGESVIHCPMAVTDSLQVVSPILGINFITKAFSNMAMSGDGRVKVQTWDGLHYACKMGRGVRSVAACGPVTIPAGKAVRTTLFMPVVGRRTNVSDGGAPVHVTINDELVPPLPQKGLLIDQVSRVARSGKVRVDILNQSLRDITVPEGQEVATVTDLGAGLEGASLEAEYVDEENASMPLKDFNKIGCICNYDKIIDILDCSGFTCRGADQVINDIEIRGPYKENVTINWGGKTKGFRLGLLNDPDRKFKGTKRDLFLAINELTEEGVLPTDDNKVLILTPHLTRYTFGLVHCIRTALFEKGLEPVFGYLDEKIKAEDCVKCYQNRFCAQVDRTDTVRVPEVFVVIPNQEGELDTEYFGQKTLRAEVEKGAFSIPTGNVSWARLNRNCFLFVIHHPDVWFNRKKLAYALQCTLAAIKPNFPKARVKVVTSVPVVKGVTTSELIAATTTALQRSDFMEYDLRMGEKNPIKRKEDGVINHDKLALTIAKCQCFLCRPSKEGVKDPLEIGSKRMKVLPYMLHPDYRSGVKIKDLEEGNSVLDSISIYASDDSEPPYQGKCTDTVTEIDPPRKVLKRGVDNLKLPQVAEINSAPARNRKQIDKSVEMDKEQAQQLFTEHLPSEASSAPIIYKKTVDEEMEAHLKSLESEETVESIPKAAWVKDNNIEKPMEHIDMEHTREDDVPVVERIVGLFKDTTISFNKTDHSVINNHWLRLKVKFRGVKYLKPIPYSDDMLEVLLGLIEYQIKAGIIAEIDSLNFMSPIFCVPHNSAEKSKLLEYHKRRAQGEVIPPLTDEELANAPIGTNRKNHVRYRLIFDAVKLNTVVCKVPGDNLIQNTQLSISSVVKAETLSLLDVKGAFTSLPVSVMSRKWLGLALRDSRLLCFCFAPLGLSIVPSVFSRILMGAVRPSVRKHCRFHLDDILLFSSRKDHPKLLEELFEDLEKVGMLVEAKKLQLMKTELVYLGFHIKNSKQSIQQISYQVDIDIPTTRTELAAFLGRFNYYSHYLAGFGMLAALLHPLLKVNTKFEPSNIQIRAMKEIVRLFLQAPSLYLLDPSKELYIACDASIIGSGSVLFQKGDPEKGEEQFLILSHFSCKFSASQIKNCSSLEMELLSIIRVMSAHKHLVSMGMPIIVLTDCKVLCCLKALSGCISNSKLARWYACLESLAPDLTLKWTTSKDPMIGMADFLSRLGEKHVRLANRYVVNLKAKNDLHAAVAELFKGWDLDGQILTHKDIKELGDIIGSSPLFKDVLDQVVLYNQCRYCLSRIPEKGVLGV